jgi:hypothetical protein
MADEPENITLVILRDIRAKQDEHTGRFERLETQMRHVEKQLEDLTKVVRYGLGQTSETQFRQSEQESRIDELFDRLEKLLNPKEPV